MKKICFLLLLALLPVGRVDAAYNRVGVHDPSVVWESNSQTYYIFGSFRKVAKTKDMMNWTEVALGTDPDETVGVPWKTSTSDNAMSADAFSTPAVTTVNVGGQTKPMPAFDAKAWSAKGTSGTYVIKDNLWAPDVIWNPVMQKWCMYMSVNGGSWYSSIVLLTADNIEGPYTYQAPIVISGFTASNYTQTDLPLVIGEGTAFPDRYASPWVSTGKAGYPNNIDPCVFYDENGKLWMSYGSWSGGIFMLELDENTGLRDYNVSYETSDTSDPYFGKKIAGGYYSSGEASYIEYINGYYYLFLSYGGLESGGDASNYNYGGYQMRVFRSKNPDGPYVDSKTTSAIYNAYRLNFGANANDNNRGENIFGCYGNWGYQTRGIYSERSQGHNSIIAAPDGRTYLVYHTRFQNRYEFHEVRVHQVFQNEDGWLVAAPFEYSGETVTSADIANTQQISTANIPGHYKLLVHRYGLDHTAKEMVTPVEIELMSDGTVTGAYTGTWSNTAGKSYVQITLDGTTYKGVIVEQTMEPTDEKVVAFTAMSNSNGVNIWGHQFTPDEPVSGDYTTGILAYYNFDVSPIANYYNAEQTATLQKEGDNTVPVLQSDSERDGKVMHTLFGASNNTSNVKFANPLYGKSLTDGATVSFWVNPIDENLWDALFSFYKSDGGRLYMTGNNYIGYNSGAWIDLNHPNSVTTNDLVFGAWNFVTVTFSRAEGVKVYVDGVHKPFQVTANGDATLDYHALMVNLIQDCPDFYFGYGSWWGSANALFDELLIHDRPLTANDAKALYQKEKADSKFLEVVPEEPAEVPTPVYFNDFSSTDGVTVIGSGEFITDADPHYGQVYHNDPNLTKAVRTNYLKLPEDVLMHAATTKEMTITFWVNKKDAADYYWSPVFTAYGATNGPKATHADDWWPFFYAETRGVLGWNSNGYCDFTAEQNDTGTNTESTVWTDDGQWHLYTMTFTPSSAKVYIDGEVMNSWTIADNGLEGLFTQTNLVYVCLGGNQAWGWNDPDPAFAFDDFAVYDAALTAGQIAQIIADKNADLVYNYTVTANYGGNTKPLASGTGESGTSVTVAYPRYILDGTTLYEAAAINNKYSKTFTLSSDNQEEVITYNASTIADVYYYAEAEDVLSGATSDLGSASNGKLGGRQKTSSTYTELVTLPAGTWQITTAVYVGNSGDHTVNFKVGDEVKWTFTRGASSGWYTATSESIVLTEPATVSVAVGGGGATGIDWIYIKSAEPFEVVGETNFTTAYLRAYSTNYTLRKGETRVFTFQNHSNKSENYDNWLIVVNEGETQKAITRADFWDNILSKHLDADGNDGADDWALMSTDGGATKTNVNWDSFAEDMANARVVATVSYSAEGQLTINAVSTGVKNGYQYFVDNVGHVTGTGDMTVCLSVSNSWLEVISVSSDYEPVVLALKDKADNAEAISANIGATVDVKLEGRTLMRTGDWNTLTLPFSVADINDTPLEGATIKELDATASGLDAEGVMTLKFKVADGIEAGKPYLVRWTEENLGNITDPLFTGVRITTTEPEAVTFSNAKGTDDCEFVGQFSPFAINSENINEIIFLGSGNKLGYSQGNRNLNSFRAHFRVPSTNGEPAMSRGVIDFGDGETTGIIAADYTDYTDEADAWYSLDGRKIPSLQERAGEMPKGVYIHKGKKVKR